MEDSKLEFPTIKNAKCEPLESYQSSTFEQKNKIPYALVHSSLADTINVLFSYLIRLHVYWKHTLETLSFGNIIFIWKHGLDIGNKNWILET